MNKTRSEISSPSSASEKKTAFFQPKIAINQPNDVYEQEADAVAEKIMAKREIGSYAPPFFKPALISIQRKCAHCEEEEKEEKKVQRKENNQSETPVTSTENFISTLSGGRSLNKDERNFFESKMGYDLSSVRLHTDDKANESAKNVNALAYTTGNNIVFGAGQYQPGTGAGTKLLAHELTHVVQQKKANLPSVVQRVTSSDLRIRGLAPDLAAVNNIIRFEYGSHSIPAVENPKIVAQASPPARNITLNGYSSEESTAAINLGVINKRISAVSAALSSAGHTGPKHPNPNATAGVGNIDYRGMRIVEIVPTPVVGLPVPTVVANCAGGSSTPCGTSFSSAAPIAIKKVAASLAALVVPNAATLVQVSTFFGATPAATLLGNINNLLVKLSLLIGTHNDATNCHINSCDGTCASGAGAYVDPQVVPQVMILCDSFRNEPLDDKRADTIIHEALHVTPGVLSKDTAYAHTRKFRTLTDAERLRNTDSYVNLIKLLFNPAATITAPPVDTVAGTASAAENTFAQRAIDFLEQWLISAKFTSGSLYEEINNALTTPAGWTTPALRWFHQTQHDLSPLFGLTDPGLAAPFGLPVKEDKIRVAGINDRYRRMRSVMWGRTITLTKISAGTDAWAASLGNSVNVTAPFFALSNVDAIKYLIQLMLKSMPDVLATLVNGYTEGVDKMRRQNSVGP